MLELRRGGLPFPHGGPNGEWRYRHAVGPDGPTPLDYQTVADFFAYGATGHARMVQVEADPDLQDWLAQLGRPARVRHLTAGR